MSKGTAYALGVLWAGAGLLSGAGAVADDYLRALESEAAEVAVDDTTLVEPDAPPRDAAPRWNFGRREHLTGIPPGLDFDAFEKVLRDHFHGSYAFYVRLDQMGRKVVYDAYQRQPDIDHVRNEILVQLRNR